MKYLKLIIITIPFFMMGAHAADASLDKSQKYLQEHSRKYHSNAKNKKTNGKNGRDVIKVKNNGRGENGQDGVSGGNGRN